MLSSLPSDDPATKDDRCWVKNLGTDFPKPFFDCGGHGGRIISDQMSKGEKMITYLRIIGLIICLSFCSQYNAGAQGLLSNKFQLSQDMRNTTLNIDNKMKGDIDLHVQIDIDKPCGFGGITVKGGERVSFDKNGFLTTDTPGFWRVEKGKSPNGLFKSIDGKNYALIKLKGNIRWDNNKNLTDGQESFFEISTIENKDKFYKIVDSKYRKERLIIITEKNEKYILYNFSPLLIGTIEKTR
jgi:hypothetical protein